MATDRPLNYNGVVIGTGGSAPPRSTAAGTTYDVLRVPSAGAAPAFGTFGFGTSGVLYTDKPALMIEMSLGTAAAPVTTLGAVLKISKVQNYTTIPMAGCGVGVNGEIDPDCGASLMVYNQSLDTSKQMGVAIGAYAFGDNDGTGGGSGDQYAFFGTGRKAGGTYGGAGGGYFEGQRFAAGAGNVLGVNAIGATGAELRHSNFTAVDCVNDGHVPTCVSAWLAANSTSGAKTGVGAMVFDVNNPGLMVAGFVCADQSIGATGACFDDFSHGGYGIRLQGTKVVSLEDLSVTTFGIRLLGTYSSGQALQILENNSVLWINGAGTLGTSIIGDATNNRIRLTSLTTTGAATGKKVVCVDTATGALYASSTGVDCSN